ncbi:MULTISPECIES: arylesterase [Halomonadaceae]|uniref:Arylesterase n=2 Tax=Halomonadaceae TaxID=28256 RepID=A0ABS6ZJV8_9GAMM|nr:MULTISPECIES: arylesterase [Halomonas]MBW6389762.1 arylesterase [Halomonas antri]QTP60070.1 arylesterase [Halomonas sulfidivorans]
MVKGFPIGVNGVCRARQAQRRLSFAGSACVILLALMLAASAALAAERPIVLVMGDSLSTAYGIERETGWVRLLEERLDGHARVVNASISGETSSGGASRLPELIGQHDPDIVLLELGGNDGLRGLPPSQLEANLAGMIEASQSAGAEVLLLGIDIPPNYGPAYRRAFTDVFARLADNYNTPLVPFLLEGVALEEGMMQDDGIHPTSDAQPIILDNVWPELAPLLEGNGVELAEADRE